jgi:hypothetical protein
VAPFLVVALVVLGHLQAPPSNASVSMLVGTSIHVTLCVVVAGRLPALIAIGFLSLIVASMRKAVATILCVRVIVVEARDAPQGPEGLDALEVVGP